MKNEQFEKAAKYILSGLRLGKAGIMEKSHWVTARVYCKARKGSSKFMACTRVLKTVVIRVVRKIHRWKPGEEEQLAEAVITEHEDS